MSLGRDHSRRCCRCCPSGPGRCIGILHQLPHCFKVSFPVFEIKQTRQSVPEHSLKSEDYSSSVCRSFWVDIARVVPCIVILFTREVVVLLFNPFPYKLLNWFTRKVVVSLFNSFPDKVVYSQNGCLIVQSLPGNPSPRPCPLPLPWDYTLYPQA